MNLVITITAAGADTGPFNIYSDVDGYINAFDTNISKAVLLAGFATANVPDGTTEIKVMSVNALCNNSVFSVIVFPTTTTTTSTSSSSTTTTTTTTEVVSPCSYGMDVVFFIDITNSMQTIIESVKSSVGNIVDAIENQVDISTYRLGLMLTDEVVSGVDPNYFLSSGYTSLPAGQKDKVEGSFTDKYTIALEMLGDNNESSFTVQLNKLNTSAFPIGSGVETAEPMEIGLQLLLTGFVNPLRGVGVVKYVLIFTDAPPGGDDGGGSIGATLAALTATYISMGIKVFVFGQGAIQPMWQNIATNTGGAFNTDYSGTAIIDIINEGCSEE